MTADWASVLAALEFQLESSGAVTVDVDATYRRLTLTGRLNTPYNLFIRCLWNAPLKG